MIDVAQAVRRFFREESGATMVEYSIMVVLVAAVAIAIVKSVGTKTNGSMNTVMATPGF